MRLPPLCAPLLLFSIALSDVAHAKPASDWATRTKERQETKVRRVTAPREENPRSYALPLGLAYFAPPVVFGSLAIVSANNDAPSTAATLTLVGLGMMFVAPAMVHSAYGNGPGAARAAFASLGSTLSTAVVGGLILLEANDCTNSDDGLCRGFSFLGGAVLGGVIGYTTWAIIDISLFARKPDDSDPPRSSRLQLTPTFGPIITRTEASHTPTLHGISLGVVGRF